MSQPPEPPLPPPGPATPPPMPPQAPPQVSSPPGPGGGPRRGAALVIGLLVVLILAVVAIGVVVLVGDDDGGDRAGPGASVEERPVRPEAYPVAAERLEIVATDEGPEAETVRAAIADVDAFWRRRFEPTFGIPYRPVEGGLYAITDDLPHVPCVDTPDEVQNNAFYCNEQDLVAWDADGLAPDTVEQYGPLGLALVLAHEWGHVVQERAGEDLQGMVVVLEQQADCYAGAWVADVRSRGDDEYFVVDDRTLDRSLAGLLAMGDEPGSTHLEDDAHGTAFDRVRAFQEGFEGGPEVCAYTYEDLRPRLVDVPFREDEIATGGNLDLQDAFDVIVADLEHFWAAAWPEVGGEGTFEPPELVVFPADDAPVCDDPVGFSDEVFYCPARNQLAVQDDGVVVRVHEVIGDFALGQLVGSTYSLAVMDQLGVLKGSSASTTRTADCLAGAWSASVFAQNRPDAPLLLSAGDLDEAVTVLLVASDHAERSRTGSGAERVAAYRGGFMEGVDACRR